MTEVLLYSGGLDSFILAHMYPNARLLYINSGARYSGKEIGNLKMAPRNVTVLNDVLNLSNYERDDAIVPARNLLLLTIASYYGDTIYLAATSGDRSTDKDETFASETAKLLNYVYDCHHFERRDIKIDLSSTAFSKGQLVRWYLANKHPVEGLLNTLSCYAPTPGHCGQCKACIRRWTALATNGIETDDYIQHPKTYDWTDILDQMNTYEGWRCPDEDVYTTLVLERHGVI